MMVACIKFRRYVSDGFLGNCGKRENLDEGRKVGGDSEFFAGDRDGDIDAQRRSELNPHVVRGGAVEGTDAQALLHPAEEQLDLPALAVEFRDGGGWQRLLVGP